MSEWPAFAIMCGMGRVATKPATFVADETEAEARTELAHLWKVICHDDPKTTMEFVVDVFTGVFRQPMGRAVELMVRVHEHGSAVVGLWPESVARRKVSKAQGLARADGFPLTFSIEEDA